MNSTDIDADFKKMIEDDSAPRTYKYPERETWCRKCSENFKFSDLYAPENCPTCTPIVEEEAHTERRNWVLSRIAEVTPQRYRATDTAHPDFNSALWTAVKDWRPTPEKPWLGLIGPSGASKTRAALLLMREIVLEQFETSSEPVRRRSPNFTYVESYFIARCVLNQYSDDPQEKRSAKSFLERLSTSQGLLVLDDFGKAKNTPSYSAHIFAILDERHAHNLPTIWTANSAPEQLVAGMGEDMAGPLAGRLIDCSKIVTVR